MNYQALLKGLSAEMKANSSYNKLPKGLQILMSVVLFPVAVLYALCYIEFSITSFIYNLISSPCEYLEKWSDEKRKDVHWLSEAVIFCITLPFIFFLRVLLSFTAMFYAILWVLTMACAYILSLGGIRWQPYITSANYSEEYCWSYKNSEKTMSIFSSVVSILTGIIVLVFIINRADLFDYEIYAFFNTMHNILIWITSIAVFVGIPLVFAKDKVCVKDTSEAQDSE